MSIEFRASLVWLCLLGNERGCAPQDSTCSRRRGSKAASELAHGRAGRVELLIVLWPCQSELFYWFDVSWTQVLFHRFALRSWSALAMTDAEIERAHCGVTDALDPGRRQLKPVCPPFREELKHTLVPNGSQFSQVVSLVVYRSTRAVLAVRGRMHQRQPTVQSANHCQMGSNGTAFSLLDSSPHRFLPLAPPLSDSGLQKKLWRFSQRGLAPLWRTSIARRRRTKVQVPGVRHQPAKMRPIRSDKSRKPSRLSPLSCSAMPRSPS